MLECSGSNNAKTLLKQDSLSCLKKRTDVSIPKFDRANLKFGIIHLGVGGFHRSHQALYIQNYMEATGDLTWGICGVGILDFDLRMKQVMEKQDCLYTLVERGNDSEQVKIVGSIGKYIFAPENPQAVIDQIANADTKILTLTITEGGYYFNNATGALDLSHPSVANDLLVGQKTPKTVYWYLYHGLMARKEKALPAITIVSCDNIQGNGDTLKRTFLSFLENIDPEAAKWITQEISFPNTMVDRITPVTTPEHVQYLSDKFSLVDEWPVVSEDFTQWVIEDRFSSQRPNLEKVGAFFTKHVHPYEKMKIRLLNASHSAMGYLGYLAGFRYINDIAKDLEFQKYVRNMMDLEVSDLLSDIEGINLEEYKDTLIFRFSNHNIKDQAARICMDGSAKMPKFILPSIEENLARGASIDRLSLVVASWFRYLSAKDENGEKIKIEDPRATELVKLAKEGAEEPSNLLSLTDIFGDLSKNQNFVTILSTQLKSLYSKGARATLKEYI